MSFFAQTYRALFESSYGQYLSAIAAWLNGNQRRRFRFMMLNAPREKSKRVTISLPANRAEQLRTHAATLEAAPFLDFLASMQGKVEPTSRKWARLVLADFMVNGSLPPLPRDGAPLEKISLYLPGQMHAALSRLPKVGKMTPASALLQGRIEAPRDEAFAELDAFWPSYATAIDEFETDGQRMFEILRLVDTSSSESIQISTWMHPHTRRGLETHKAASHRALSMLLWLYQGSVAREVMLRVLMAYDIVNDVAWPVLPGRILPRHRDLRLKRTMVRVSPALLDAMEEKLEANRERLDIAPSATADTALRYAVAATMGRWQDAIPEEPE